MRRYAVSMAVSLLAIALGSWGCASNDAPMDAAEDSAAEAPATPAAPAEPKMQPEPEPEPAEPAAEAEPAPPQTQTQAQTTQQPEDPTAEEFWQDTVWVDGGEGKLIRGLDGGEYPVYKTDAVQKVQQELQAEGVYQGQVTGVLDQSTMEAIGQFQENNNLQVCGVPTPLTRQALFEG